MVEKSFNNKRIQETKVTRDPAIGLSGHNPIILAPSERKESQRYNTTSSAIEHSSTMLYLSTRNRKNLNQKNDQINFNTKKNHYTCYSMERSKKEHLDYNEDTIYTQNYGTHKFAGGKKENVKE